MTEAGDKIAGSLAAHRQAIESAEAVSREIAASREAVRQPAAGSPPPPLAVPLPAAGPPAVTNGNA